MTDRSKLDRNKFVWKRFGLHYGQRKKPILTLVRDADYPHLYHVQYPDGWTSTPGNLTRAKDAAYGHARHLLGWESRHSASPAAEEPELIVTLLPAANEAA